MKLFLSLLAIAAPVVVQGQADFFGILSDVEQGQGVFRCGAALIHEDIMVTGSFCTQVGDVVRVGYKSDNETLAIRTVTKFLTHPMAGGQFENFPNDIEVFKLNESITDIAPVKFNYISAIPPDNGEPVYYAHAGAVPDVGGAFELGNVPLTQTFSTELQNASATTENFLLCNNAYTVIAVPYRSALQEEIQFCTTTSSEVGPCDSAAWGSPLWVMNADGEPLLVGTASQGSCTPGNPPFIWTRVAPFASFLKDQICDMSANRPADCP